MVATDRSFHRFTTRFPNVVPRLLGRHSSCSYHAESIVPKKEHQLDSALVPSDPAEPRLLLEFQGYQDKDIFLRIVTEAAIYCEKERYRGPLVVAVVFTDRAFLEGVEAATWLIAEGQTVLLKPQCVVLEPTVGAMLEESGLVELVPLLPLCAGSAQQAIDGAPAWKARIETSSLSNTDKVELTALLGAFIVHRQGKMTLQAIKALLGGFEMENTQVGRDLIEIGRLKGIAETRHEAEQARQQAQQEAQQAVRQARQEDLGFIRQAIIRALVRRFGVVPRSVQELLRRVDDIEDASTLIDAAQEAKDIDTFRALLQEIAPGSIP